ncbi:MAG: DMT family transporter [Deltaproteobacteria bacterium]|nr:DMT family transporter [Deltaproteobacteria bacterium]
MQNWYTLSIAALLLMGTQRFLYKVAAERKCSNPHTTFFFMATVAVLSSSMFLLSGQTVSNPRFLLFIALLNSAAFLAGTLSHIEALKHIPATVAYPIIRFNIVIVILFSIIFLHDRPSLYQLAGILAALSVMIILSQDYELRQQSFQDKRSGYLLVATCVCSGAIASISCKFAAILTSDLGFMALSYFFSSIGAYILTKRSTPAISPQNKRDAFIIGVFMGFINFAGFYLFLQALSMGPLSIIVSITGMHFIIAALLSVLVYHEHLTPFRIAALTLTVASIILLRL